jgi:hypothetical protein
MTRGEILGLRPHLENLIAMGENAKDNLRALQEACEHPETDKTTTTQEGWATEICGVCHKKDVRPFSMEAKVAAGI